MWHLTQAAAGVKAAAIASREAAAAAARESAATAIQAAWRSWTGKRLYTCLVHLIMRAKGAEPARLLRYINAREAALIEPGAGLHVRLRLGCLGGSTWPPHVLYRISTHRPVAGEVP